MEPIKMDDLEPPRPPRRNQGMPWWPAVMVIALLAAIGVWFLWSRSREARLPVVAAPEPAIQKPVEEPLPETGEPEAWDLPSMAESDDFLRDIAGRLSSHPEWLSWIANDDLVRRFVAGVDEVARGELPAAQAGFLVPKRGFSAASSRGRMYLGPESHARYTRLTGVISGLDAEGVASLYVRLEPLFDDAYRDLGYPQGEFDAVLDRAIRKTLATPDLDQQPELVEGLQSFKFADQNLEALAPVQKFMLRLGPDNASVVKAKLREIKAAIDRRQARAG